MNKVILKGFLTKDPESIETKTGKGLCKFTIAVSRRFKKDETDFIFCTAWDKTAEFITKYFSKGSEMLIIGRLEIDKYQDSEGKPQFKTNVVIEESYFCGKKTEGGNKDTSKDNAKPKLPDRSTPNLADDEVPF